MVPTVCAASTVTVRGAVMTVPKLAVAPIALGPPPAVQLPAVLQLPLESTFHVPLLLTMTPPVITRSTEVLALALTRLKLSEPSVGLLIEKLLRFASGVPL